MEISLAPSPTAIHSSTEISLLSIILLSTSALEPSTRGPVTSPVSFPSFSSNLLVNK